MSVGYCSYKRERVKYMAKIAVFADFPRFSSIFIIWTHVILLMSLKHHFKYVGWCSTSFKITKSVSSWIYETWAQFCLQIDIKYRILPYFGQFHALKIEVFTLNESMLWRHYRSVNHVHKTYNDILCDENGPKFKNHGSKTEELPGPESGSERFYLYLFFM